MSNLPDTPACFRRHMGLWLIEPAWMQRAVLALQMGQRAMPEPSELLAFDGLALGKANQEDLFARDEQGVAVIRIEGAMSKWQSKFGGTSTKWTQRALTQAMGDSSIRAILLAIDSPGGMVAGVQDLANEVAKAVASGVKPVLAHIEDTGASAAYWVASQAQRVTANMMAYVGSIGVFAVLEDLSGLAERQGVRVVVKSTGPYKGLGAPGTPITSALEDEVQKQVDEIGQHFFQAVQQGRRLGQQRLAAVTDGRKWIAQEALQLGLIDGIQTFDEALQSAGSMRPRQPMRRAERLAHLQAMAI